MTQHELQKTLERVTSKKLGEGVSLTDDEAALRESFLGAGESVERRQEAWSEASLLASLDAEFTASAAANLAAVSMPSTFPRSRFNWTTGLSLLATSLLVAMVIYAAVSRDNLRVVTVPAPQSDSTLPVVTSPAELTTDLPATESVDVAREGVPWDDSLDEQIAAASEVVASWTTTPTRWETSISTLDSQLSDMASDLADDSL